MMMADSPDPLRGTGAESACIEAAEDAEMLRELAQIGMRLVRLVEANAQARMAENPAADLGRVDQAFAKLSRSIRLTLALKAKLADSAAKRDTAAMGAARTQQADESRTHWQKVKLEHAVTETLEALDAEHLLADLHERLDDADIAADLGTRTMGEMVARVCDDLGIGINRDLWKGKGWKAIRDEAFAMMEATTNPGANSGPGPDPP